MVNHHVRLLHIEVELEFSRLASEYLTDAYAQILPETRSTPRTQKPSEPIPTSIKEAQS